MFIGIEEIRKELTGLHFELQGDAALCLTGFMRLDGATKPYSKHILYLTVRPMEEEGNGGKPLNCLSADPYELPEIQIRLQRYFLTHNGDALFVDSLFEILTQDGTVQQMAERAYLALRNPIFVFDAGFNLIGAAVSEDNTTTDGPSLFLLDNKGFSAEHFQMANRDKNIHERVLKSHEPIEAYNDALGYTQLLCAINTERDVGHIVVNEVNHPFTDADKNFIRLLRRAVNEKLRKDEFLRQNRGSNIEYYLKDLLDGKIVTGKRYRDRMDFFKAEFSFNLYCLVIELARSSHTIDPSHICSLFSFRFRNAIPLVHNGQIVVLFRIPKGRSISPEEYEIAETICTENGLFAGISNRFSKILHIQDYWRQALRAIELGIEISNTPALFRYQNFVFQHVANLFLQKESATIFCHPVLKQLIEHDRIHGTELAKALYTWVKCERNTSVSADALGIHRHTMINRMKQIQEMTGTDFDDYRDRLYLLMSYELLHAQQHRE